MRRGVHKAPANEVVVGAIGLEANINQYQQELPNPLGINRLRFFPNRGYRVWGGRRLADDPEWKYVNVRRYFLFLEKSIERARCRPMRAACPASGRRICEQKMCFVSQTR